MKGVLLDAWDTECITNSQCSCLQGVYLVLVKSLNNNAVHAVAVEES